MVETCCKRLPALVVSSILGVSSWLQRNPAAWESTSSKERNTSKSVSEIGQSKSTQLGKDHRITLHWLGFPQEVVAKYRDVGDKGGLYTDH
jgi:hypothetical protein